MTIRRLARKPCKLLTEQHSKLYVTLEKQAKDSLAKHQTKADTTTTTPAPPETTKLTNGDAADGDNKTATSEEPMEPSENESTENGVAGDKKTAAAAVVAASELNGNAEGGKANGGSVVVLD